MVTINCNRPYQHPTVSSMAACRRHTLLNLLIAVHLQPTLVYVVELEFPTIARQL